MKRVTVIGAAIMDIHAGAVSRDLFSIGSVPAQGMEIAYGGDALNESVILSDLGVETELISVTGDDETGKMVAKCLEKHHVSTDKITVDNTINTGINIVLTDTEGERYFITDPKGSLRRLSKQHILPYLEDAADIISFASMFVSPELGISEMTEIFREIKKKPGRTLVLDMTTAKKGEKIEDIEEILKLADYVIPSERETYVLTGEKDPVRNAEIFTEHGAKCVIIKCGKDGCIYKRCSVDEAYSPDSDRAGQRDDREASSDTDYLKSGCIPAYTTTPVDTTGAGDSFVAGFIYGLVHNLEFCDCLRFANATASLVVEKPGTQGIINGPDDVKERFESLR